MANKTRTDNLAGSTDIGGQLVGIVQCPIFDPREDVGNFAYQSASGRLEAGLRPFADFNPFQEVGFVYVVNVLTLPYYEISIDYTLTDSGYSGRNWTRLLEVGADIFKQVGSIGEFIKKVVTRVRLGEVTGAWSRNSRKYVMKVTSPALGQILPNESVAVPVWPALHSQAGIEALSLYGAESERLTASYDRRLKANAKR